MGAARSRSTIGRAGVVWLGLAILGVLGLRGPEIEGWVTRTMREGDLPPSEDGRSLYGTVSVRRWGRYRDPRVMIAWDTATGRLAVRRQRRGITYWDSTGSIDRQYTRDEVREAPPWLWGETDQLEPTAPWSEAGLSFSAWRERAGR